METDTAPPLPPPAAPPQPELEENKLTLAENADRHVHVAEVVSAVDAEVPAPPAVPPVQTAAVTVETATVSRFAGKLGQEGAAIQIQTAFRGYLVCVAFLLSHHKLPFSHVSSPFIYRRQMFSSKFNEIQLLEMHCFQSGHFFTFH